MSIMESMNVAAFMMLVVFAVLLGLYLCIKGFSFLCVKIENRDRRSDE